MKYPQISNLMPRKKKSENVSRIFVEHIANYIDKIDGISPKEKWSSIFLSKEFYKFDSVTKSAFDELNKLIEEWTINFAPEEVMKMLQSAGVPCGIVADGERLINDPHLKARGYYWELKHPEMGVALTASQPFKMSETPAKPMMPAPCLGEHTEFVCRQILRMSDEEFVEFFASGCFE